MILPASVCDDPRYAGRLVPMTCPEDIPLEWRNTPIEALIRHQNLDQPIPESNGNPQLLIATCIEFRYALPVPRMYAYVIRRASGRLAGSEFSLAYILAKGVEHLALIGHNDCGMTKVAENRIPMIEALISQGWAPDRAEDFINGQAARHSMTDELDGLKREYLRLRRIFKKLVIAPLFVDLANTQLFIPKWYTELDPGKPDDTDYSVSDIDLITEIIL